MDGDAEQGFDWAGLPVIAMGARLLGRELTVRALSDNGFPILDLRQARHP